MVALQAHLLEGNYLTAANTNHPENFVWDPENDANHVGLLEGFVPASGDVVGIGFAVVDVNIDASELPVEAVVRLSRFSTSAVSVGYGIYVDGSILEGGRLEFRPGETVRVIEIAAVGEAHFCVDKRTRKGRTCTGVRRVDGLARVEELARLLDGSVSEVSVAHAKTLLAAS